MTVQARTELRAPAELKAPPDQDKRRERTQPPVPLTVPPRKGAEAKPAPAVPARPVPSKLTSRILAVNVVPLLTLVGGVMYLGQYEDRLIQTELAGLVTEAKSLASGLAGGAVDGTPETTMTLVGDLAQQLVRGNYEITDSRTRLFGIDGGVLADSRILVGPGGVVEILPLPPPDDGGFLRFAFDTIYDWVAGLLADRPDYPVYEEQPVEQASDYPSVVRALEGDVATQIWSAARGGQVLGAAVPVQRVRAVLGAVLVTTDTVGIESAVQLVREDILKVFAVALAVTVLLSLYLARTIARPIRRLAKAARDVQRGQQLRQAIPDFSHREDEIGELSQALRDMAQRLWTRMEATERFAADVSHEIKNPLTSLRSAVETTMRVKDPAQLQKLLQIIVEDVARLDRLITDISDASRLDAELSRAETEPVDLGRMLQALVELYRATQAEGGPGFTLTVQLGPPLKALGIEGRLVQVFRNLITNAISFSPPGGMVAIAVRRWERWIEVTVEDDGPGIPELKMQAIFDRFYSERPPGEKFGTHSGLGLSISKQIVEAHRGEIFARNRAGRPGASFTVRIPALPR